MEFDLFTKDIVENKWAVFGTEVYENGVLTHSFGDTDENIHEIYSATKSVLSMAAGIAWDRGLFDITKPLLDYLPKERIDVLPEKLKEQWKNISIERLMTMSVGDLPFRPEGEDQLDFSLRCEVKDPDARPFNYSNISAYLVGVALTHALKKDVGEFIEEEILKPLGIEKYELGRCTEGYFYGASKMRLTVHGLSQIGLVLFNRGIYNGKRILSEEYIDRATSVLQMNREGGYGYFFWKYKDGFSINGKWKQKCYILPKEGILVTYLSHIEDDSHALLESMEKHILGL
ncbi:MAG: serine hydrolase [Clostridiales bacterium]|nr:serine hydrolase [Clostridiales bacterium]